MLRSTQSQYLLLGLRSKTIIMMMMIRIMRCDLIERKYQDNGQCEQPSNVPYLSTLGKKRKNNRKKMSNCLFIHFIVWPYNTSIPCVIFLHENSTWVSDLAFIETISWFLERKTDFDNRDSTVLVLQHNHFQVSPISEIHRLWCKAPLVLILNKLILSNFAP